MPDATSTSAEELQSRLEQQELEILRLRDLLVGMDAELGVARGRSAELEARTMRLTLIKQKLETRLPLVGKLARGLRSLLRGS